MAAYRTLSQRSSCARRDDAVALDNHRPADSYWRAMRRANARGPCSAVCLLLLVVGVGAQMRVPPVQVVPPGDTGRRVTEDGLLANYFPAARRGPAVLMLPGS